MKKISIWLFVLVLTTVAARAQDAEATERINKVEGYVQDLQTTQLDQKKQIQALEKEIADLREKLNQPAANDSASQDDLKKLAGQVQELAKKQQADNDQIVKTLDKLGKISASPAVSHKPPPNIEPATAPDNSNGGGKQSGYYYEVQNGNTLSAIVKACRDQKPPIKVTVEQILKANPGLDPKNLIVGKKIFIPASAP